jgi:hypothetical protein
MPDGLFEIYRDIQIRVRVPKWICLYPDMFCQSPAYMLKIVILHDIMCVGLEGRVQIHEQISLQLRIHYEDSLGPAPIYV